jgi:hypothetical protein
MRSMPQREKNKLRDNLVELVKACPVDQSNPDDCPLYPLRRMRPTRRLHWFNTLTEDDLAYLASYHQICLTVKVESRLAMPRSY